MLIPVSAIIPTYNRAKSLQKTLLSLAKQNFQFSEIIIVDASDDVETELLCSTGIPMLRSQLIFQRAVTKGAASQRNEGVANATQSFVAFMDDDIYLEPFSLERLLHGFEINHDAGGISA